jgi:hypothetical protein
MARDIAIVIATKRYLTAPRAPARPYDIVSKQIL